jgi:general stress protein 26
MPESCGCDVKDRVKALLGDGKAPFVMATVDAEGKPCARWMGAFARDPENPWILYAASFSGARKMQQIALNPNMQLVFGKPDLSEVATLIGTAVAENSPEVKQLVWNAIPMLGQYFTSVDGEDFGVIKFTTKCMELLALQEQHEPYCIEA